MVTLAIDGREIQAEEGKSILEVARDNNNVLIELPQETSSGYWRVWVNKNQILPE